MRRYQKWTAVFICIVFMSTSFLSFHLLAEHWEHETHECNEEHCAVCSQITSARTLLGSQKADRILEAYLFVILCMFFLEIWKFLTDSDGTLIGQKVRLDC